MYITARFDGYARQKQYIITYKLKKHNRIIIVLSVCHFLATNTLESIIRECVSSYKLFKKFTSLGNSLMKNTAQ